MLRVSLWQIPCERHRARSLQFHGEGTGMTRRTLIICALCVFISMSAMVAPSDATVFGGSKIVAIDQGQRTISFQTKEGETWTLPVADPDIFAHQLAKGDIVTIELDLNDQITKVLKMSEVPPAPPVREEEQ